MRKQNRERRNRTKRKLKTMGRWAWKSPRHGAEGPMCPICAPRLHASGRKERAKALAAIEQVDELA